ncbi:hypothetical protein ACJMK2_009662 [Sinanodonta woodiana]|uniref:NFX1-type zinc finger-containing protein 1 n=1 Tax=Sinanodonta woodiana TaxID=1069815 RepID=A0ABD3VCZ5_SINWO
MKDDDSERRDICLIPNYMTKDFQTNGSYALKHNEHRRRNQRSHSSDVQQTHKDSFLPRGNIDLSEGRRLEHHAKPHNVRRKEIPEHVHESHETDAAEYAQDTSTSEVGQAPVQEIRKPSNTINPYLTPRNKRYEPEDDILETHETLDPQHTSKRGESDLKWRTRGIYQKIRVGERESGSIKQALQESSPPRNEKNLKLEYEENATSSRNSTEKIQCHEDDSKRKFGYKALMGIFKTKDVEEVVLIVNDVESGFPGCLMQEVLKQDLIVLIVGIFQKACLSHKNTYLLDAFQLLNASRFLDKVEHVLSDVQLKSKETRGIWGKPKNLSNFLVSLLCVLSKDLELIPDSFVMCNSIIVHLNEIVKTFNISDHETDIVTKLRTIKKMVEVIRQERNEIYKGDAQRFSKKRPNMDDVLPHDNFRKFSIVPERKDLQWNETPFLRAKKGKGSYKTLDDYLDIQFHLLREDYIKQLRDGIDEYREHLTRGDTLQTSLGLLLYSNVHICRRECSTSGLSHILQFTVDRFDNINWNSSGRLQYGSLVVLTPDNFDTILFATVTKRDPRELQLGFVQVCFENRLDLLINITPNDIFVMAEAKAHFEAYRHTLKGLQEIQSSMPFQKYFVECQMEISPPKYLLSGDRLYDFTPLMKQKTVSENCTQIEALTTKKWPTSDDLGLDSSQYKALQTSLTKELAVIQGPPGTGKTFIGLKITELLLHNHHIWKPCNEENPILIVCYTNHALDQFLEGVLNFCSKDIVRIGGSCSNEAIKPFVLQELISQRRKECWASLNNYRAKEKCKDRLKQLRRNIAATDMRLQACLHGIVSVKRLKEVMTDNQFESLAKGPLDNIDKCLLYWLEITPDLDPKDGAVKLKDSLQTRWKTAILHSSVAMDMHQAEMQVNVWNLPLLDRVKMYKLWVQQALDVLNNRIDELSTKITVQEVSSSDLELLKDLKQIQSNCQSSIVNEQTLNKFVPQKSQRQIKSICEVPNDILFNGKVLIEEWLCVTGAFQDEAVIMHALKEIEREAIVEEPESDGSDIEKDRALNHEGKCAFSMENTASNKTNTQNRNRELTEDLIYVLLTNNKDANQIDDANNASQIVSDNNDIEQRVHKILSSVVCMSEAEAGMMTDIWLLPTNKRHELYRYWLMRYRQHVEGAVRVYADQYTKEINKLHEVNDDQRLSILKSCKVLGMTTAGVAKYRHLIQTVKPKLIIVEEAADVLESHIVTILNPECQHLILIRDSQYTRPNPCIYELAKKYHLDISLFERFEKNGINCVTLLEQHRMRPEISVLVKQIYPNFMDHSLVKQYGNVKGLERNVFFIDHTHDESYSDDYKSYLNVHEAKFIAAFAKHLLNQGYMRSQITILATEMSQVISIRRLLPKNEFEGPMVTSIENFQGEQNDIILLSLVRSTRNLTQTEDKTYPVIFRILDDRLCIAISRAKMGLYVIGNFQFLLKCSDLWRKIVRTVQDTSAIGSYLSLRCQVHGTTINVACEEDFFESPNGGCTLPCNADLPNCQHRCKRYCHIIDRDHNFKCFEACNNVCEFGHQCKKLCFQTCGPCTEKVEKFIPMCKHKALIPCHKDPTTWRCYKSCETLLPCGHACKGFCCRCAGQRSHQEPCREDTEITLGCGHRIRIPCHKSKNDFACICGKVLPCLHKCAGTCEECFGGKLHHGCDANCDRFHSCGHRCQSKCSSMCPPCSKRCKFTCPHDVQCLAKCGERCTDCYESCAIKCEHGKCSKLCHEPCEFRCDNPCLKILQCKHRCKGLCGEECLCIICDGHSFMKVEDTGITQESIFIRLTDCRCIIEVSSMDEWMKSPPTRGFFLRCPKCSGPVLKGRRYKDVIKKSLFILHETHAKTYGTEHGRQLLLKQIKSSISELYSIGCTDFEKERLMLCLETETPVSLDYLHAVRTKIKYLSCILNIERFVKIHIRSNTSFDHINTALNSLSKYRNFLAKDRYRGFHTEHFWVELGQELSRIEYIFKFEYIETLRTRISFPEAVVNELPRIPAYLDDPNVYDKVRLLFQFASASALASGVSIPPIESLNL